MRLDVSSCRGRAEGALSGRGGLVVTKERQKVSAKVVERMKEVYS